MSNTRGKDGKVAARMTSQLQQGLSWVVLASLKSRFSSPVSSAGTWRLLYKDSASCHPDVDSTAARPLGPSI